MGLDSKVGIELRDGIFATLDGILNLDTSIGTHWVCYNKDSYFDSYGISPLEKFLKI